jgi:CRP-like cAMP-binding protein
MTDIEILKYSLETFGGIDEEAFQLSTPCWQFREYKKGGYYNEYKSVCKYLGFIVDGVFRSFIIDVKTGEEKNIFLYAKNQFVVTFKSFIDQVPCDYHTQAMTDAKVICISVTDLLDLYKRSHKWECFGRLLAQQAFNVVIERMESFLFRTPEQRYLDLIKYYPGIFNSIPLYHISSYLGIQGPSLSRIRKRIAKKYTDFNLG